MEIWKDIKGYEGLYQVSNLGRVKSLERRVKHNKCGYITIKQKILKNKIGKTGYFEVDLRREGTHKYCRVHRLVAEAFIKNPKNYEIVNHKDENKLNNNVENLEWCTAKYNMNYGTLRERTVAGISKRVAQINKKTDEIINIFPSSREASKKTGISQGHISSCCAGKRKTAGGYKWRYADDKDNSGE